MKKNKNNKGFSGLEFLTVACLCGVFSCVILSIAFSTANQEKIKTMRYKAQTFKNNAESYAMITHIDKDTIFLWDLLDKEISGDITSPFSKSNNCDIYNSYVDIVDNKSIVTLKCDDYLIYQSDLTKDKVIIYSVSNWQSTYPDTKDIIDKDTLYNYEKDGKEMLEKAVSEKLFLKQFNEKEKTEYKNIYEIKKKNIRIYGKTAYRTRKAILELSN